MVTFDEVRHVLLRRAAGMGMDLLPHLHPAICRSSKSIRPNSRPAK